jgi:hypothetical protein
VYDSTSRRLRGPKGRVRGSPRHKPQTLAICHSARRANEGQVNFAAESPAHDAPQSSGALPAYSWEGASSPRPQEPRAPKTDRVLVRFCNLWKWPPLRANPPQQRATASAPAASTYAGSRQARDQVALDFVGSRTNSRARINAVTPSARAQTQRTPLQQPLEFYAVPTSLEPQLQYSLGADPELTDFMQGVVPEFEPHRAAFSTTELEEVLNGDIQLWASSRPNSQLAPLDDFLNV